jgi:hypothetical protein
MRRTFVRALRSHGTSDLTLARPRPGPGPKIAGSGLSLSWLLSLSWFLPRSWFSDLDYGRGLAAGSWAALGLLLRPACWLRPGRWRGRGRGGRATGTGDDRWRGLWEERARRLVLIARASPQKARKRPMRASIGWINFRHRIQQPSRQISLQSRRAFR